MPHEKPRRPAHPSSPSFHTSPALSTKGAFHTRAKRVTGAAARRRGTGGGACARTTYLQLPRTALTRQTISLLGIDALLGAAAHGMADHSSPAQRARRGADTQRAVYAQPHLQVGTANAQQAACPATQM